jgi:hypothetical protein
MHPGSLLALQLCSLFASSSSSSSSYLRLQGAPCQHTHTQTTASLMQLRSFLAPLSYLGSLCLFLLALSGLAFYLQKIFPLSLPCSSLLYHHDTPMPSHTFSWQGSISNSIHAIHRYANTIAYLYIHASCNTQGRREKKRPPKPIKPRPSRWILAAG